MTLVELKNELEYRIITRNIELDEEYIPHVASLTFDSNYIQIYYDYGIKVLHIVLETLENNEIYEQCAVIKQTIENLNKLEKLQLDTNYDKQT